MVKVLVCGDKGVGKTTVCRLVSLFDSAITYDFGASVISELGDILCVSGSELTRPVREYFEKVINNLPISLSGRLLRSVSIARSKGNRIFLAECSSMDLVKELCDHDSSFIVLWIRRSDQRDDSDILEFCSTAPEGKEYIVITYENDEIPELMLGCNGLSCLFRSIDEQGKRTRLDVIISMLESFCKQVRGAKVYNGGVIGSEEVIPLTTDYKVKEIMNMFDDDLEPEPVRIIK